MLRAPWSEENRTYTIRSNFGNFDFVRFLRFQIFVDPPLPTHTHNFSSKIVSTRLGLKHIQSTALDSFWARRTNRLKRDRKNDQIREKKLSPQGSLSRGWTHIIMHKFSSGLRNPGHLILWSARWSAKSGCERSANSKMVCEIAQWSAKSGTS